MDAPVRLGLIGAGRWGRVYLRTLARRPDVVLAAVASGNAGTAAVLPAGCALHADWRALAAQAGLDGVIVATPPATHLPIAGALVEKGLAVLVEKPLCLDPGQAAAFRRLAAAHRAVVAVDHIHLFAPAFRRLKQLLPGIGAIRSVAGRAGNHGPYRADASVLWDWGPHDVAMAVDLFGRAPDAVSAWEQERRAVAGGEGRTVAMELRFGAVRCDFRFSTLVDKCRWFQVAGETGTLVYDDLAPAKLTLDGQAVEVAPTLALDCVIDDFVRRIHDRDHDLSALDLAVTVTGILAGCADRAG